MPNVMVRLCFSSLNFDEDIIIYFIDFGFTFLWLGEKV